MGTQRGGKSSLLNMLFNRQMEGFGLGHYMDPQTDGLWMWIREHPQKPGLRVMYLDTEGASARDGAPPPRSAGQNLTALRWIYYFFLFCVFQGWTRPWWPRSTTGRCPR